MPSAGRAIAGFDSASAMVRVLGRALRGRESPLLGQLPAVLEPAVDGLLEGVQRLPPALVEPVYRWSGWADAVTTDQLRDVRADRLAEWVVRHYPRRRYPLVFVGSSNGALLHVAAALGAPWLPQTLLLAVRHGGLDPDDPVADLREFAPAGRTLLDVNADLALHHMHDPSQDRLMIARMTYFRVKLLALPPAYRAFLRDCLAPGGTLVLVDCGLRWPTTTVGDRQVFQFGALGGATAEEFHHGGERVAAFLRRQGSTRTRWGPPPTDGDSPEAEWGFAEPLAGDVVGYAGRHGVRVLRLAFDQPEDLSPPTAELFRRWYAEQGRDTGRLLAGSFLLIDPLLTMRTGQVPYWAVFGTQPSLDRLNAYLASAAPYDEVRATVFPHGVRSIGMPDVERWQAVTGRARRHGELVAVAPDRYPRHFRALSGFHRELARLPRVPPPTTPLDWPTVCRYLAHDAGDTVTLTEEPTG